MRIFWTKKQLQNFEADIIDGQSEEYEKIYEKGYEKGFDTGKEKGIAMTLRRIKENYNIEKKEKKT